MNRVWMTLAVAVAMLFAVSPALASSELESDVAEMKELVKGLQQKVEAQEEQLQHQNELLEQAQTAVKAQQEQTESLSGLSNFLDSIDVTGHVATSYSYNFNTPRQKVAYTGAGPGPVDIGGVGLNTGVYGSALPFHRDHNQFVVDQVWFGVGKAATNESPAGFQVDLLYGNTANFLGQGTGVETTFNTTGPRVSAINISDTSPLGRRYSANDSTSDFYIAQAYVEYACDCIAEGSNIKVGKFQTMTGAEVVQATGNFNITRGIVYQLLQPVDHIGAYGTTDFGPVEVGAAIVNSGGSSISSPDLNKEKSYIGTALVGNDRMSLRGTFIYGAETIGQQGRTGGEDTGLVDLTAWFNPTDNVSLSANYDYLYTEGTGSYANGIAVAGRVGITDAVGAAIRGEYVSMRGNDPISITTDPDAEFWALTGTVDYALTDHLTAKAEVRYDAVKDHLPSQNAFAKNRRGESVDQTVGLIELVYEF